MSLAAGLPAGDPAKGFWTYADIAAHVALSEKVTRQRMREWAGFPEPLPYSRRELRWNPPAVLAFFARFETAQRARAPQFQLIQGGRAGA